MTLKPSALATGILIAGMFAGPAMADHNSPFGEGFANMPNDVHNTRVDTREADDNDSFIEFVRYGAGASTVNRFLPSSTDASRTERNAPPAPKGSQR